MQGGSGTSSAYGHNLDVLSSYSQTKSMRGNQSEATIDIHIKYLKLKVPQKTVLHIVWSRGKKHARTQSKVLSATLDKAVFEEKFQINTLLELDQEGIPLKEKISKMTVVLDKSMGEIKIAEAEFNMADFSYGEYKPVKLILKKCKENTYCEVDPEETYLDIGLKGTRAKHLQQMNKNPNNPFRNSKTMRQEENTSEASFNQRSNSKSALVNQEAEIVKKENKQLKKDHARQVQQMKTEVNNLYTSIENLKTDLQSSQTDKEKLREENEAMRSELDQLKRELASKQGELVNSKKLSNDLQGTLNELKLDNQKMQQSSSIEKDNQSKLKMSFQEQIIHHYSFDRFETDYVADAAMLLFQKKL